MKFMISSDKLVIKPTSPV